jgi:hypothetical protein
VRRWLFTSEASALAAELLFAMKSTMVALVCTEKEIIDWLYEMSWTMTPKIAGD